MVSFFYLVEIVMFSCLKKYIYVLMLLFVSVFVSISVVNAYTFEVKNWSPFGILNLKTLNLKPDTVRTGIILDWEIYVVKIDPYHEVSDWWAIWVYQICDESGNICETVENLIAWSWTWWSGWSQWPQWIQWATWASVVSGYFQWNDLIFELSNWNHITLVNAKLVLKWPKGDTWATWSQWSDWNGISWINIETTWITHTVTITQTNWTIQSFNVYDWVWWGDGQWIPWPVWPIGPQWPQGPKGATWATWPQGPQWPKGNTGAIWPIWPKWDTWAVWPQWSKGNTGAAWKWIKNITQYYAATSTQSQPTIITSTTIPTLNSTTSKYLWQKQVITFTDNTTQNIITLIAVYWDTWSWGLWSWYWKLNGSILSTSWWNYWVNLNNNLTVTGTTKLRWALDFAWRDDSNGYNSNTITTNIWWLNVSTQVTLDWLVNNWSSTLSGSTMIKWATTISNNLSVNGRVAITGTQNSRLDLSRAIITFDESTVNVWNHGTTTVKLNAAIMSGNLNLKWNMNATWNLNVKGNVTVSWSENIILLKWEDVALRYGNWTYVQVNDEGVTASDLTTSNDIRVSKVNWKIKVDQVCDRNWDNCKTVSSLWGWWAWYWKKTSNLLTTSWFDGSIAVNNITASGNTSVKGGLTVTGSTIIGDSITVNWYTYLGYDTTINWNTYINGRLAITGTTNSKINMNWNINITWNLKVINGTITTKSAWYSTITTGAGAGSTYTSCSQTDEWTIMYKRIGTATNFKGMWFSCICTRWGSATSVSCRWYIMNIDNSYVKFN